MPGTTSICVWHRARAEEVTGGRGKASSQRPVGHSWAPWFGLWGVRWISHGCDEHLKSQGFEKQCFVVFGWQLWELWRVSAYRSLAQKQWLATLFVCQWEKHTKVFLCLSASLEFGEIRYLSPRTEQQICPPVLPACDSGWEDCCGLHANMQHPRFLLLPASWAGDPSHICLLSVLQIEG